MRHIPSHIWCFTISLTMLFSGCVFDKDILKFVLVNQSKHWIYYELHPSSQLTLKDVDYIEKVDRMKVAPDDSAKPLFARNNEDWTQKIYDISKDSTFRLFVFNVDSVKKYGWKQILSKKLYERYDLRPEQLDTMKWHFIYHQ